MDNMLNQDKQRRNSVDKGKKTSNEQKRFSGQFGVIKKDEEETSLKKEIKTLNSTETLYVLSKPQVFSGPTIEVQDDIIRGLEEEIMKLDEKEQIKYAANTCVGGIKLTSSPNANLQDLISNSTLIDLKGDCVGMSSYNLAKTAGVDKKIVENTLSTMDKAGQLDYLRKSDMIGKDWEVIIEVHYYRDRDLSQTKFHKDTRGQTLFVNLNFANTQPVAGPEYIINPATGEKHEDYVANHLPTVFTDDLREAKKLHGDPNSIGATVMPIKGVVAFVDEAIHHKTPTLGHRTASGPSIDRALSKAAPDAYKHIKEGYETYKNSGSQGDFSTYIDDKYRDQASKWLVFLTEIDDKSSKFDRTKLSAIFPKMDNVDADSFINKLMEAEGIDFLSADLLYVKLQNVQVKKEGRPPLQRQMSQMLLEDNAPQRVPGKRTFFRTWVRAVPTPSNTMNTALCSEIATEYPEAKKAYESFKAQWTFGGIFRKATFKDYLSKIPKTGSYYAKSADIWEEIMIKSDDPAARYNRDKIPSIPVIK